MLASLPTVRWKSGRTEAQQQSGDCGCHAPDPGEWLEMGLCGPGTQASYLLALLESAQGARMDGFWRELSPWLGDGCLPVCPHMAEE